MLKADDIKRACIPASCNWPTSASYDRQKSANSVEEVGFPKALEY
jgi:hypothetical protein